MSNFRLTKNAENDLREIWRYTRDKWSENQADSYLDGLEGVCRSIGRGDVVFCRSMPEVHENLRFCLHERHYVFWLEQADRPKLLSLLYMTGWTWFGD